MRIHLDNVNIHAGTGPNTFANRLAQQFFCMGHDVIFEHGASADVSLVFIERSGMPLAEKVIQRLDGIWFKPEEFCVKNVGIKSLYESADCVIFQSQFDRDMSCKWWGKPRLHEVIHNGINLNPLKQLTIPKLIEMRATFDKIYVCSSNWHPQKRLKSNYELFQQLRMKDPNSCLIVMGNHPDFRIASPNVFHTGPVRPEIYNEIYSAANWMLHLAWADHCPNVVVEALAQGTPVICSDVGGTKELVGSYGMVLKDQAYNFELADYDNPPDLDITQVTELPDRKQLDYSSIADIDISSVAKRYIKLFEELVRQ